MNSKIVNVIKKGELIFLMEKETKKSLLLITFGVVLFALLMHFSEVIKILQRGVSLTLPIMVGLILAFVLNVPMKMFERLFAKLKKKYPQLKKIPVMLPPMELQKKFVDFVIQVDKSKVVA